jgi:hypothetical protein
MSERRSRVGDVLDVVGVGLNSAVVGGAAAGTVYGIGAVGMAVGRMARAHMAGGVDGIAFGLAFFGMLGGLAGAAYGVIAGIFVGLFAGLVFAIWLTGAATRALPLEARVARARWVALASTFLVAAVPVLWWWYGRGDESAAELLGIPTLAALAYAPHVGGRVAREIDARNARR